MTAGYRRILSFTAEQVRYFLKTDESVTGIAKNISLFIRGMPACRNLRSVTPVYLLYFSGSSSKAFLQPAEQKKYVFPLYSELISAVSGFTSIAQTGSFAIIITSPVFNLRTGDAVGQ
jgi:hypothetical protein